MHIDVRALVRGADQLEMALRHVEAAQRIRAPLVMGRGRARESVDAALGAAHEWATSASRSLQHGGSAVADARVAVDQLAAEIDAVRFRGDVFLARKAEGFRALTDGTRRSGATRSLDDLRWITERESMLAAPDARSRAWAAFGEVLAKPDRQIEMPDLLRIRRILDLPDGIRPDLPSRMEGNYTRDLDAIIDSGWLPRHDWQSRTFLRELRSRLSIERLREEGARLASDPAVTPASIREQVHRIVAKPEAEVTLDDMRQLALMDELPSQLQPGLPNKAGTYSRHQIFERAWLPRRVSDARQEFASLRLWSDRTRLIEDPHVTKETLGAALDAMLARSDARITSSDLRRLAAYDALPGHLRPALPPKASAYTREELYASSRLPRDDPDAGAEFATLRQFRAAMLRPRESNTAEALAIIDKPRDQLTHSDAQRLALLGALPAEHRPDIPPIVRVLTRDTLTDDIARIALKPNEQITRADVDRVALVDLLPAELRPDLPPLASTVDRGMISRRGFLPSTSWHSRAEFASLRRWAMLETEAGRTTARQRAVAGEQLDPLTLESLARGGEETLRSVGMSTDDLLRHSVNTLRASSPKDLEAIDASLRLSKQLLAGISDTTQMRQVAAGATELIDLNLRRLAGQVSGQFGRHPDHAEIGRAIEQVELVLALRAATPQGDRVASAAAQAADPLPW